MHMCPQDIENSSPCGTEIKLHKVKNHFSYLLLVKTNISFPQYSSMGQEGKGNAHSCLLWSSESEEGLIQMHGDACFQSPAGNHRTPLRGSGPHENQGF